MYSPNIFFTIVFITSLCNKFVPLENVITTLSCDGDVTVNTFEEATDLNVFFFLKTNYLKYMDKRRKEETNQDFFCFCFVYQVKTWTQQSFTVPNPLLFITSL